MAAKNNLVRSIKFLIISSIAAIALVACGGGELPDEAANDLNPDISNLLPIAIIVATPQNAAFDETVTLDGSLSNDPDGDAIASYTWSQAGGEPIEMSALDQIITSFVAPGTPTTITIQLVVTDAAGNASEPATASITVTEDGEVPPAGDDDVPLTAVFVSKSLGIDTNSGTYRRPVATISRGIEIAGANALSDIFVMEGAYEESALLKSGLNIRGCAASWDENGNITYAASNAGTTIKAPAGSEQAILAEGIHDTSIECFSIVGGSTEGQSFGMLVKDSQQIAVRNTSFVTPGSLVPGTLCSDLEIKGSDGVSIASSAFRNSGLCNDYIAVSADSSQDVEMDADAGSIDVTLYPGSESSLKAFQAITCDQVIFRGVMIADSADLPATAVFTGIALNDVTNATIEDNNIDIKGGSIATGASLRCTDPAVPADVHYTVSDNSFSMEDVTGGATGIRVNCNVPYGDFDIDRNRFRLVPKGNTEMNILGVEIEAQMRPLNISIINNIFVMPISSSGIDKADKTGITLSNLDTESTISALHNTFITIGSDGELHAINSNCGDVQFSTLGNIAFVCGNNSNNALFRLPEACQTSYCARNVVANLVNNDCFGTSLWMTYYYDTDGTEDLDVINEGVSLEVDRRDNQIAGLLIPYFDLAAGELTATYQAFAKDLGPLPTSVTVDVDGNARDGLPDIGATEY
ncbi:MAG: hypothetical protein WC683_00845 [bacterium]